MEVATSKRVEMMGRWSVNRASELVSAGMWALYRTVVVKREVAKVLDLPVRLHSSPQLWS